MSLPATSTNTINMQINDGIQKPSGKADVGLMACAARAPLATVCSIELVTTASFIDRNYEIWLWLHTQYCQRTVTRIRHSRFIATSYRSIYVLLQRNVASIQVVTRCMGTHCCDYTRCRNSVAFIKMSRLFLPTNRHFLASPQFVCNVKTVITVTCWEEHSARTVLTGYKVRKCSTIHSVYMMNERLITGSTCNT